jgi:hypothetical protein
LPMCPKQASASSQEPCEKQSLERDQNIYK